MKDWRPCRRMEAVSWNEGCVEDRRPCGETGGHVAQLRLHGGLEAVLRFEAVLSLRLCG
jgi:hypothetical protein